MKNVYTYTVLVATLRTRSSPRPPLESSGRRYVLCSALSLYAGSPSVRVLVFAVSRVLLSRLRCICAVHVIVFLHNIIILYCAFSKFENSIGLLVCDEKLTCDQSLPARLEWRAESLRWGLAESFCWPLSLRSPQRVSCIMLLVTVFV